MASDDWFRRKTWSEEDEAEFFTRLKRSRGQFHKAQYLRIQATYLEDEYPEIALRLIAMVIEEYPEPFELPQAFLQKAHCLIALGRTEDAILSFRKVFEHEEANSSSNTQGYLDFSTFVVVRERRELYAEVKQILHKHSDRLMFPVDHYRWNSALAIISEDDGDLAGAGAFAARALDAAKQENSGFRYHPKVGLVKKQDKRIRRQLLKLAKAEQFAAHKSDPRGG
ncbi:tetratricopeptide repeat protein [Roseibacillus persicicus]|nr:hypothetical protein [Roseibacillus persicicus]